MACKGHLWLFTIDNQDSSAAIRIDVVKIDSGWFRDVVSHLGYPSIGAITPVRRFAKKTMGLR